MDRRVIETQGQLVQRANGLYSSMMIASHAQYLEAYSKAISQNPERRCLKVVFTQIDQKITWAEGCPTNEEGGMLWTSNICIRKTFSMSLNGLDERFKVAFEDVDLWHTVKKNQQNRRLYSRGQCLPSLENFTQKHKKLENQGI